MESAYLAKLLSINCYPQYLRLMWWRYLLPVRIKRMGIYAKKSVRFHGMPICSLEKYSRIEIGDHSTICSCSRMTALGVNHPVVLRTLRPNAVIKIGSNTGISGGAICAAISVNIGNECLLGANVTVSDTDFHTVNPVGRRFNTDSSEIAAAPVVIEDNVFIGTGSVILKGVVIGENSVIGAGSVVTKDVPPNVIVAGNPAKLLRVL